MASRFGPGPVFVFEMLTAARRRYLYLARAGFVLLLLLGLWSVARQRLNRPITDASELATIGQEFFGILAVIQITLILLVAPASTAGAICLDRARGTLTHMLVTDLSASEIILGKLAARLIPTLSLVLASLPVMMMATLLGGIDPSALVGLTLISIGVAVLGCSLAILLSVWAAKTQDVLLAIFTIWTIWLLSPIFLELAAVSFGFAYELKLTVEFLYKMNPYSLTNSPYATPLLFSLWHDLAFLIACLALSFLFAGIAIQKVRNVSASTRKVARTRKIHSPWAWLPSPSLDANPVLWREWNQARPSGWGRLFGRILIVTYGLLMMIVCVRVITDLRNGAPARGRSGVPVVGICVGVGLLILSVNAATSLAEERVRGSLDVLLTTPLSSKSILTAKWLGAFLRGIRVAILPSLLAALMVPVYGGSPWALILMPIQILAAVALLTSCGLLVATLTSRVERAVGVMVAVYIAIAIAAPVFLDIPISGLSRRLQSLLYCASPAFGVMVTTVLAMEPYAFNRELLWGIPLWIVLDLVAAFVLFQLTLLIFDRKLGRVSDRTRPKPLHISNIFLIKVPEIRA